MDKKHEKIVAQIEQVLRDQLAGHEQLLELLQRKRLALRKADEHGLIDCCRLENQKIQLITELEKQRQSLGAQLTLMLDPAAPAPLRLADLAQRLPEPARGRLLVLRAELRQRMEKVRAETNIARRATEALSRHMQGIIQSIGAVCGAGGVYARGGGPAKASLAIQTFNTTA